MEYQTIDIPKIKTKVLNIYPVIQCKRTPIFFYTLKADFFTLMNDYTWNCTCLNSLHLYVCGVDFPLQKATIGFFPLAQDLKTSQTLHTNTERPTSSNK